MKTKDLEVGDKVVLKSGSHPMTVITVKVAGGTMGSVGDPTTCEVAWYRYGPDKVSSHWFPMGALKAYKEDER
jgi:hypothetical protein